MDWPKVQISDLGKVGSGTTPKRGTSGYYGGEIPWVKSGELNSDIITDTEEKITHLAMEKHSALKIIPRGSLLVAMYGATVGQVAFLDIEATSNQAVCHIVPNENIIHPRYLFHILKSLKQHWLSRRVGGGQPNISMKIVKETEISLPPLDEQKRIADILDKANEIKQASDKTEDIRGQFANAIFLDIFGDPVLNTKNWDTLPMTEIFEIITGKLDSNAAVEGGEYPFFTCAKEASQIDHFAFDCECLLLAGNNASGDFDVKYYNGKFNAYQRTYILTTDKIEYDYARFALDYQLKKLKQSSLGTNTRYLTMGIFKRMHIQIPSRDLQKQFSLYYNALRNSAEQDEIKISELLKSTESLILMNH